MTNILQKKMTIEGKLLRGRIKLDSSLLFVAGSNNSSTRSKSKHINKRFLSPLRCVRKETAEQTIKTR